MTNSLSITELRAGSVAEKPQGCVMDLQTSGGFDLMLRVAKMFAASNLVPDAYRDNVANCTIAINMSLRMGVDPLTVVQNLHIIKGRPSWSSTFLIASVNASRRFGPLTFVKTCDDVNSPKFGVRAQATDAKTGEILQAPLVNWDMVKAEGWDKKQGSKWVTMPELMFMYRAAAFWSRLYASDILMGFQTKEEIEDVIDVADLQRKSMTISEIRQDVTRNVVDSTEKKEHEHVDAKQQKILKKVQSENKSQENVVNETKTVDFKDITRGILNKQKSQEEPVALFEDDESQRLAAKDDFKEFEFP